MRQFCYRRIDRLHRSCPAKCYHAKRPLKSPLEDADGIGKRSESVLNGGMIELWPQSVIKFRKARGRDSDGAEEKHRDAEDAEFRLAQVHDASKSGYRK